MTLEKELKIKDTITKIWNIKKQGIDKALLMFYIELKLASNNKNIYEVRSFLHCKVKFAAPYLKCEILHCNNCQQYKHVVQHPGLLECNANLDISIEYSCAIKDKLAEKRKLHQQWQINGQHQIKSSYQST